jgi:sulfur relay (sulfurtransferase) DsrF/TusC family protein
MQSIVILCDQSPVGTNAPAEAIRIGSGLKALGDTIGCKVVFTGDAVHLMSKNTNPGAVRADSFAEILEMAELSELPLYVVDSALADAGMAREDLITYNGLSVITTEDVAKLLAEADCCFWY